MAAVNFDNIMKILERIVEWGYTQALPLGEIIGQKLEADIITAMSLYSDIWLVEYSDYWEAINEPVPENVLEKMRGVPGLAELVAWVDKHGNGVW